MIVVTIHIRIVVLVIYVSASNVAEKGIEFTYLGGNVQFTLSD